MSKDLQPELREPLNPLLAEIASLNERIAEYDTRVEQMAREKYPEVARLQQVKGVEPLIALTFVLTWDVKIRKSRTKSPHLSRYSS